MTEKAMNYEQAYKSLTKDIRDLTEHFDSKMKSFYDPQDYKAKLEVLENLNNQIGTYNKLIGEEVSINDDYKLKGWDWAELADKLNIEIADPEVNEYAFSMEENDILYLNAVKNYLHSNYDNEEVWKVVRDHLKAIAGEGTSGSYNEVWAAMLKIKYDDVFKQFVFALLPHMWT